MSNAGILGQLEAAASQEQGIAQTLMRSTVMNVTTGGMAGAFAHQGLGDALAGSGTDVSGLHGAQIGDGSALHHGPDIGGEAIERPSAGYLADTARSGSVEVGHEAAGMNVSSVARNLDDAGHLSMRGVEYDVFDYLPGGDAVQIAAGRVDPAQVMGSMAGEGIEHGMMFEAERGFKDVKSNRNKSSTQGKGSGGMADDEVEGPHSHTRTAGGGAAPQAGVDGPASAGAEAADDTASGGKRRIDPSTGQHIPDADENARDMEELMFEHGQRLDTAVAYSGQSTVHSELHAHGRTLEIDTEFEAKDRKDVPHEVQEAEGHSEKALHSRGVSDTVETDTSDMRFRSQVHAHLDAMSRDEGMSV